MSARATVVALWVAFVPTASAGTEESPEVTDGADDTWTGALMTGGSDILAFWVHDETPAGVRMTMKLALLAASHRVDADAYWSLEGPEPRPLISFGGVRAKLGPSGASYHLLAGAYPGTHFQDFQEATTLVGHVRYGEPGYVTWEVPTQVLPLPWGTTFIGWGALTYLGAALDARDVRDAAYGSRPYQVGFSTLLRRIELPVRDADRRDAERDVNQSFLDLRAAWVDTDEKETRVVLEVARVGGQPAAPCHARILVALGREGQAPLAAGLFLRHGPNRTEGIERLQRVDAEGDSKPLTSWGLGLGRPGHVELTFARAPGESAPREGDLRASLESQAPCRPGTIVDVLGAEGGDSPGFAVALVLLALLVVARRKL